jgi:hypothetical protein
LVRGHIVLRAVAFTVFIFSLLVWVYVVVIQVTHTDWLALPFSHVRYPPFDWRLDEVGMLAFAVAAIGFLIWQIERSIAAKTR